MKAKSNKSNIGVYQCRKCQNLVPDNQGIDMTNNVFKIRIVCLHCSKCTTRTDNHKRHIQNCVGKQKKIAERI